MDTCKRTSCTSAFVVSRVPGLRWPCSFRYLADLLAREALADGTAPVVLLHAVLARDEAHRAAHVCGSVRQTGENRTQSDQPNSNAPKNHVIGIKGQSAQFDLTPQSICSFCVKS